MTDGMDRRRRMRELIASDDPFIYDVAAEHGQIVGNVKHLQWFENAVLEALEEEEG